MGRKTWAEVVSSRVLLSSLLVNPDLGTLAKRLKSARQLADSASNAERRSRFERIEREQAQHIQRILESAGLVYVCIDQWANRPEQAQFAVLAGRGHNRPQAPSASQPIYRHGGLTLMEMLTPWLVLGPVQ